MRRPRALLLGALAACSARPAEPPRAPAPVLVPPAPPAPVSPVAAEQAPPVLAPPSLPAAVDGALPAPERAQIVAVAADGSVLLSLEGWTVGPAPRATVMASGADGLVRSNLQYLAVLDARHACLVETARTTTLDRAAGTGTVADALSILRTPAAGEELDGLRRLAERFGTRNVGPAAFGADASLAVVEANNQLYVREAGGAVAQLPVGTSARITASPDGRRVAFAQCGSPCGGVYVPAVLDTRTRKVRRYPVGDAHDFHWSRDGETLVVSYDDRPSGIAQATRVCLGRIEGSAAALTPVKCWPSRVTSTDISAASPGGGFVGLQVLPPGARGPGALRVLEMPAGREVYRIDGDPIYADLDDRGRVAWDDNGTPAFHPRVRVASSAGEERFDDARSAGFLPDGSVLVLPDDLPTHVDRPARTLAAQHCGFFEVRATRR